MGKGLSPKQSAFCREYVLDYNATQAATRAGYSPKTARQQASQLLTKLNIQQEISKRESFIQNKVIITKDKIIRELAKLAFSDIADHLTIDEYGCAQAVALADLPVGASRAIKKVKERRIIKSTKGTKDSPDGEQILESTFEYELHGKENPLIQLGKELGMFRDKHEVQFDETILSAFMAIMPPDYQAEFRKQLIAAVEAKNKK